MQLRKIKSEKISLQEDIKLYDEKEKKLRQEVQEARNQNSNGMTNPMPSMFSRGSMSGAPGGGGTYQGYVNRHRGAMIVGKVQMTNNFLSMKTMGKE